MSEDGSLAGVRRGNQSLLNKSEDARINESSGWQDSKSRLPGVHAIHPQQILPLKQVSLLVSGGSKQPYSHKIRQNQLIWAYSRHVRYVNYLYSEEEDASPEIKEIQRSLDGRINYWIKVPILRKHLNDPELLEGSWIVWADDDVVINDFLPDRSMLDRAINKYGRNKALLIAKDKYSSHPFNAGIILIRKNDAGRALINELWKISGHPVIGYRGQPDSFHEQQALGLLFNRSYIQWFNQQTAETIVLDYSDSPFREQMKIIPNREGSFNLNTFICENRKIVCSGLVQGVAADRRNDAFIHHSGLGDARDDQISQTLEAIREKYSLKKTAWIKIFREKILDKVSADYPRFKTIQPGMADFISSMDHQVLFSLLPKALEVEPDDVELADVIGEMDKLSPLNEGALTDLQSDLKDDRFVENYSRCRGFDRTFEALERFRDEF